MGKITIDDSLRAKLNGLDGEFELCDESGRTVGHYVPEDLYRKMLYVYAESQCPYTKEEQQRHRRETDGRSLKEIWSSLGQS